MPSPLPIPPDLLPTQIVTPVVTPIATSSVLHLLILLLLLHPGWGWGKPMLPAGTTHGVHPLLLYVPGRYATTTQQATKATPKPHPNPATLPTTTPPQSETTASNDALGSGTASIVLIQAFPSQKPDLSHLPPGSSGEVIVGVQIDENGRVAQAITRKGLSQGVDAMVLATVEQWVFHPATRQGHPVTSQQELHFHYNLAANPLTCGWECFTLDGIIER